MRPRTPQRGSAMLVTLLVIAALLAGAAALVSLQVSSNRSTDLMRGAITAMYCAEAGASAARPVVSASYPQWAAALAASANGDRTEPAFLSTGISSHDLDGDAVADFEVWLEDNDDEVPPAPGNRAVDNDLQVFIVSRCLKYPDTPKAVRELVELPGTVAKCYQAQHGGCGGNGNNN